MAPTTAPRQRSVARRATAWRDPACSPAWRPGSGAVLCHVASSWSHRHWQRQHHRHRHRLRQQQYQQHQFDLRSFPRRVALRQLIAHRAARAAPAAQLPHIRNHIRIHLIPASIRRRLRSTEKVSTSLNRDVFKANPQSILQPTPRRTSSMCPCLELCAKSSHLVELCAPCSFPRSPAARRPQAAPAAVAAPAPPPAPRSMLHLRSRHTLRRRHAHVPRWRRRRATRSRSFRTRIHRTTRSPTASTFARTSHPMSTFPSPSTIPIARKPRRPSSIWAPLWPWALLVALSSLLRSSPRLSSWSEGECASLFFFLLNHLRLNNKVQLYFS